ncbi:MAG TPA: PIN domain-containing protein [Acidimicrobiia bacterium]|nr:PIN domain-containing protein [Acidimicrobiia bacterium]
MARRLIFDTSALVWAERHSVELDGVVSSEDDVAVAAVTVAELELGRALAGARYQPAHDRFIGNVLAVLEVIPYDVAVAHRHAELLFAVRRSGRPRGAHDLIIAATALETEREVLTVDQRGFGDLPGVTLASWPETP